MPQNVEILGLNQEILEAVDFAFGESQIDLCMPKVAKDAFDHKKQIIFSIGKNAFVFADAIVSYFGDRFEQVLVFQASGYADSNEMEIRQQQDAWNIFSVPHPLPEIRTTSHTLQVLEQLAKIDTDVVVHMCVTGGASSAFACNEVEVSFDDYLQLIKNAMLQGFDIYELNTLRALLDRIKGGKLRYLLREHLVYTWIISDVVGDDPSVVGSGPSVPGSSINNKILKWIQEECTRLKINLQVDHLHKKLKNVQSYFRDADIHHHIVLSRKIFADVLSEELNRRNIPARLVDINVNTDIYTFRDTIRAELTDRPQEVLIWMGEPTLQLAEHLDDTAKGGRVSAFSATMLDLLQTKKLNFLALATDGKDGSSDFPGILITESSISNIPDNLDEIIYEGHSGNFVRDYGFIINLQHSDINLLDLFMVFA